MEISGKRKFTAAENENEAVIANTFYTHAGGVEKVLLKSVQRRSDTYDLLVRSYSTDNGETWSKGEILPNSFPGVNGVCRQYVQPGVVDPARDLLITMVVEGVLPTDNPLEGLKQWHLRYRISDDGGRTNLVDELVIQDGDFTAEHPVEGVWLGQNCIVMGDISCRPIFTDNGSFLVPVCISRKSRIKGQGYTYADAAVLIGTWDNEDERMRWGLSQIITNELENSTRGCLEPTIAQMSDGRLLMVVRGCNMVYDPDSDKESIARSEDGRELAGCKWCCISDDGGYSWSSPSPWKFSDGSDFYSPSSCSQLFNCSDGKCYWIGNITPENPHGSGPRYPLVIGEVDQKTFMLIKESVLTIDDRNAEDGATLSLSNFMAHEDRLTGEIVLHMTRRETFSGDRFKGDAWEYRLQY